MAYGVVLGQKPNNTTYTNTQILNPSDATLIGLNSNALPADMFNVLSHIGDVHVWRRTVTLSQPGYSLSSEKSDGTLANGDSSGYTNVRLDYGDSITVSPNGDISINNKTSTTVYATGSTINVTNKFIQILDYNGNGSGSPEYANSDFPLGTILFVTGSMVISGSRIYISKYKTVTSYKAGITIDYPVSVNPNAYQEGNNAKPAGYVLGNQTDKKILFLVQQYGGNQIDVSVASSVNVSYDGVVSLNNPVTTTVSAIADSLSTIQNLMSGKFCTINQHTSGSWISGIVQGVFYVPTSATLREETATPYGYNWYIDKYQTVTGYPAIPADTTIEYLGNLGDKARMQIVSYVGTGAYGSSNPTKITFDSPPKFVFIQSNNTTRRITGLFNCVIPTGIVFAADGSSSIYGRYQPIVSMNGNTITLMSTNNDPGAQMNENGDKYSAIAFA